MKSIRIITIGGKHDKDLVDRIQTYQQRLARTMPLVWLLLPHIDGDEMSIRRAESALLASKLRDDDVVVLLDERGTQLSSEALAGKLGSWLDSTKNIVVVIGGSYGVDDAFVQRADFVLSLSKLVFPHQLVRLILAEQLYRARMILDGHPYHHK